MAQEQTTSTLETWNPQIVEWIQEEVENTPKSVINEITEIETTNRLRVSNVTLAGLVPMHEVSEMGEAVQNQFLESWRTDFIRRNWRDVVTFSKPLMDTDLTKALKNKVQDYTRNVIQSRELNFFGLFRNAWLNQGNYAYAWGKALASTLIPRKDGVGTYASTYYDGIQRALSYSAVDLGRTVLASQVSDTGNILDVGGLDRDILLVVGPANAEVAYQIAGVDAPKERPDTANRAGNFFVRGAKYSVLVTKYFTWEAAKLANDTTVTKTSVSNFYDSMWCLLDLKMMGQHCHFYEQDGYYYFDTEINKRNEAINDYSYDAYAYGFDSPLGVFISKADGSIYVG